jgi:hypothetical protein
MTPSGTTLLDDLVVYSVIIIVLTWIFVLPLIGLFHLMGILQ